MSQFLLPCPCGASIPVNRSQAGMSLPCPQCGKTIEIPTIRKLAEFAVAVPAYKPVKSAASLRWLGPIAAVSLIICLIGFTYGGYLAIERYSLISELNKSNVSLDSNEEDFLARTRKAALQSAPADTWDYLNVMIEKGLQSPNPPDFFKVKRYLESRVPPMQISLWTGCFSFAVFTIAAFVLHRGKKRS